MAQAVRWEWIWLNPAANASPPRLTTGGPGEHLRLELADGTGHGARITLTVTGTDPAERDAAQMWGAGAVGHLAAMAAEWAAAQPVEA